MLTVELDQKVNRGDGHHDQPGPHMVGQTEVGKDVVLKISLMTVTVAGRVAAALLEEDMIDVVLHGSKPVVRLTQVSQ